MRHQGKCTVWVDSIFPVFRKWMRRHCKTHPAFVLGDFQRWCSAMIESGEIDEPPHPNAWGCLMRRAQMDGLIAKTGGHRVSVSKEAHGRINNEWRMAA